MPKLKNKDYASYFFTFLLIGLGGIPFFTSGYFWNLAIFILAASSFAIKRHQFDKGFLTFIFLLTIVLLGQFIIFNYISLQTTIGIYITFINAYLLIKLIGEKLFEAYVNIIYLLIIISFIFFIPSLLIPGFEKFLIDNIAPIFEQQSSRRGYSYNSNMIIYTFNTGISKPYYDYGLEIIGGRNPSAFHEAGGLGVYAVLAFYINIILSKNLWNKKNLIFLAGIITTFSTASYISLFVAILSATIFLRRKSYKLVMIPLLIAIFWYSFNSLEFLGRKLDEQYQQSLNVGYYHYGSRGRFANFIFDMYDILNYPLTGRGVNEYTRFDDFTGFSRDTHRNNGISDFAVKYGIPFFIFYFFGIYKTFKKLNENQTINYKWFPLLSLSLIILLGFSQVIFQSVIFIGLSFYHLIIKSNENSMALPISDK
ncbi:MAG TPA: hypothetical protein PLZ15_10775 [Melioribacteraceae bacterium]|nr:hypothetical protein [Melioribacteraceae bacterium]